MPGNVIFPVNLCSFHQQTILNANGLLVKAILSVY